MNQVHFLVFTILLGFISACAEKANQPISEEVLKRLDQANIEAIKKFEASQKWSPLPAPRGELNTETFAPLFCDFINQSQMTSKHKVAPLFASADYLNYYLSSAGKLFNENNFKCLSYEVLTNEYPYQLIRFKTDHERDLLLGLDVNEAILLKYVSIQLITEDLTFAKELIPSEDGTTLVTYAFYKNDQQPRTTIYLRSPYIHSSFPSYTAYAFHFLRSGYNFVFQKNRGTHQSPGDFQWLHTHNGDDGFATVNWIEKQPFSNGNVTAFGVSYDGFNALATALKKPHALKSIIACSAPANAETDSFTSNKLISVGLLTYTHAQTSVVDGYTDLSQEVRAFEKKNTPLENYDNLLFGRNYKEWDEVISLKRDERSDYFEMRNLLPHLEKIDLPFYHVAGFAHDQDSRDSLLAYKHLQKNSVDPEQHFLYLHEWGHGCGDLYANNPLFRLMVDGKTNQIPPVRIHSRKKGAVIDYDAYETPSYSKQQIPIEFAGRSEITLRDTARILTPYQATHKTRIKFTKDFYLSGEISLDLTAYNTSFASVLNAGIVLLDANGHEHNQEDFSFNYFNSTGSRRTAHYFEKSELNQLVPVTITFYPEAKLIKAGEMIEITLTTAAPTWYTTFDFYKKEREALYKDDMGAGYINITNPVLTLTEEI